MAADALAMQWWLEESLLVVACWLVKTATVCQSVGSPSQSKLHLSFVKVSAAVVAGSDCLVPLNCFGCC